MSSHHFVKEQQEPALLIIDLERIPFSQIASLLEWVPTVMVAQKAVEKVLSFGIKIDVTVLEGSVQEMDTDLLEVQHPVQVRTEEQGNFLEAGMTYLIEKGHEAVNIVGWGHENASQLEPYLSRIGIVFFDGPIRYYPARNGRFSKWFPEGTVQVHGKEGTFVEMKQKNGSRLIAVRHATFVEIEEGPAFFESPELFWIGEFYG